MGKQTLNYRFHDPNDPAVAAEYLLQVFIEVNQEKVERVIREASTRGQGRAGKTKADREDTDRNGMGMPADSAMQSCRI